ncbi:MAG: hypothetical protein HC889_00560 [Synechococcaceae cyanobacterium SM1_2_3]|nr:hypothetical protein [Synechococcaceae cyanobacterium SM1_2_3]
MVADLLAAIERHKANKETHITVEIATLEQAFRQGGHRGVRVNGDAALNRHGLRTPGQRQAGQRAPRPRHGRAAVVRIADNFADIAARLRQLEGNEPEAVDDCLDCDGGGWVCAPTPKGQPSFRECETCHNPNGHPCP